MKDIDLLSLKNRYHIVGFNEALDTALNTAIQVAPTDLSVLIQGESGVGKEIIPRIIHENSKRKRGKYIAINCGSIPEGTIDSELFGHKKGSYTGAIDDREGYFGTANNGTLFLDEVGELPLSTQARLLRVLETGEYIRVGDSEPKKTDVRIVAATNLNMASAIREGRFREDLYYRLCTISIKVPPLRERGNDAVLLYKKFAQDTADAYGIPQPLRLTPEAEAVVRSYKWPGNIRQLKNVTEQMSILCQERFVTPELLAQYGVVPNIGESTDMATMGNTGNGATHDYENEIKLLIKAVISLRKDVDELKSIVQPNAPANTALAPATTIPTGITNLPQSEQPLHDITASVPVQPAINHEQRIPEIEEIQTVEVLEENTLNLEITEKRLIQEALKRCNYNRKKAAQELGISDRTLYRKIKDYGIEI